MASYATERKIRILRERLGENWKAKVGNQSIDAAYNELVGDDRMNLFCKVRPDIKDMLNELSDHHDMKMAECIEMLIEHAHRRYQAEKREIDNQLGQRFGGIAGALQ